MATPVLQVPAPPQIREELQAAVVRDLLGSAGGSEEEVDENRIIDRYLVGLLAPKRQVVSAGEFDELAVGGDEPSEEGTTDVGAPQATTMFPSSFGLTFSVDGSTDAIQIAARWGFYDRLVEPSGASNQLRLKENLSALILVDAYTYAWVGSRVVASNMITLRRPCSMRGVGAGAGLTLGFRSERPEAQGVADNECTRR